MAHRDVARILRWYPPTWRDRYGDELVVFMEDSMGSGGMSPAARRSLVVGGLRERARHAGLLGDRLPPSERARVGALVVLAAWVAFVFAGSSFAKFSEHFADALPPGARALPDGAFAALQVAAVVAGALVAAGAVLAAPALARSVRSGGWHAVRGHVVRAVTGTLVAAGWTAAVLVVAHVVPGEQHRGGLTWSGALFVAWGAVVAAALVLWTVAVVAAARRLTLARSVLAAEAALAAAVAAAMAVMVAAVGVWWAGMAANSTGFLSQPLAGATGFPWDAWFGVTAAFMVVAAVSALFGAVRIARSWPELRSAT